MGNQSWKIKIFTHYSRNNFLLSWFRCFRLVKVLKLESVAVLPSWSTKMVSTNVATLLRSIVTMVTFLKKICSLQKNVRNFTMHTLPSQSHPGPVSPGQARATEKKKQTKIATTFMMVVQVDGFYYEWIIVCKMCTLFITKSYRYVLSSHQCKNVIWNEIYPRFWRKRRKR